MENNKILITIHFAKDDSPESKSRDMELMILRDALFSQLLDSIKYGLQKNIKQENHKNGKTDGSVLSYAECYEIYDLCKMSLTDSKTLKKQYWNLMSISMYDRNTLEKEKNSHTVIETRDHAEIERIVLLKDDETKKLCDLGFISGTRMLFFARPFGNIPQVETDGIIEPFNPSTKNGEVQFPQFNISTRQLQTFDNAPVEIITPAEPPTRPRHNYLMMLLPTVLSMGVMLAVRSLAVSNSSGANASMIWMTAAMGAVTLLTTGLSIVFQKYEYKKDREKWKLQYETYINREIASIRERQKNNAALLDQKYPGAVSLMRTVRELNEDVFSRSEAHPDFLTFRLGNSTSVENMFEIRGSGKDAVFCPAIYSLNNHKVYLEVLENAEEEEEVLQESDAYIYTLPKKLAETYHCMEDAPMLYSLRNCGALGIVYNDENQQKIPRGSHVELFIRRMIFELSYYHSPENLQFVIFFPETANQAEINRHLHLYAHLPHCRELFENRSQFVFSSSAAGGVFGQLMKIMDDRAADTSGSVQTPHIVVILFEEYGLKEHAFASFLPEVPENGKPYQNKLGLTFVFAKRYKEYLPEFCNDVITLDHSPEAKCSIMPFRAVISKEKKNDETIRKQFVCNLMKTDTLSPETEVRSFRMLSAIYYTRISENRQVPSSVSLYHQFHIKAETKNDDGKLSVQKLIEGCWGYNEENNRCFDVTKTLAVPIGKTGPDENADEAILDLHEKEDGPHMLVAGTTGSGKSETILSYLLGLCIRFRPDEVNLMLVDMKGGGFTKRLGMLPHVVGKISDIDGDENNTGAEYMLKRFLFAIKAEVKRRKVVIGHFKNVDSIDGYIDKCREVEKAHNKMDGEAKAKDQDYAYIRENPLTHLLLVVDEFTELKRFSATNNEVDYMGEITTIARIGRSLGIHIILISQNIEGAITDDIRVNSRSRLCLKVATRQASREMIGNDLAASPSMPGNGRGYLLVGTGSKFIYFQSAYSGAMATENEASDLIVTNVEKEGPYTTFYHAYEDNDVIKAERKNTDKKNQLQVTVDAICDYYEDNKDKIGPVRVVFSDPLPTNVVYNPAEHA